MYGEQTKQACLAAIITGKKYLHFTLKWIISYSKSKKPFWTLRSACQFSAVHRFLIEKYKARRDMCTSLQQARRGSVLFHSILDAACVLLHSRLDAASVLLHSRLDAACVLLHSILDAAVYYFTADLTRHVYY